MELEVEVLLFLPARDMLKRIRGAVGSIRAPTQVLRRRGARALSNGTADGQLRLASLPTRCHVE